MVPDFTVKLIFKNLLQETTAHKFWCEIKGVYPYCLKRLLKSPSLFQLYIRARLDFFFFSFFNPKNKLQHNKFKSECENLPIFYCQTLRSFTKKC